MDTLSKLLPDYQEYLEYERALADNTIRSYTSDIIRLRDGIGDKKVSEITLDELRKHFRDMSKEGLAPATVRRRIHSINTFYSWLVIEGLVEEVITRKLHLPKRERKQPTWLSDNEIKLFANTPSEMSIAWKILCWFGLRRSELLNLDWRDIRLQDGVIIIRDTKSKNDRVMPIPSTFKQDLYKEWGKAHMPDGGKIIPFGKVAFNNRFQKHLKECGLSNKGVTPHTLRHSFASSLIRQGVPITVVKDLLGHKDISTTMIYVHHSDDLMIDAMERHVLGN